MLQEFEQFSKTCEICNTSKYDRHPNKCLIGEAPIPLSEGECMHIDIMYAKKLKFLTCIDAYSKFLIIKPIQNLQDMPTKVLELIQFFPNCKNII